MTRNKPITILMAEDNPTDVMLTKEALEHAKLLNTLHIVEDGIEALDFLNRRGKYAKAPRPDLILLDLNMPRKNGQEVLAEIKDDPKLKHIPVVVLTTSKAEEDVVKAYGLYANCYVIKPVDFDVFAEVVRSIERFWFTVVTLPNS
ncbi:MAG TPA: response regulator [Opitutus sp.]|nr:response regulator [Opitutus sp.]